MESRLDLLVISIFLIFPYLPHSAALSNLTVSPYANSKFDPQNLTKIEEDSEHDIRILLCTNFTLDGASPSYINMTMTIQNDETLEIKGGNREIRKIYQTDDGKSIGKQCRFDGGLYQGNLTLKALRLGYSALEPNFHFGENLKVTGEKLDVSIIRKPETIHSIFNTALVVFIAFNQVGFGSTFDIQTAEEIIKQPLPFAAGFVGQFILMPLTAFAYGKILQLPPALAFGLLATGCAPGGGLSNIWTLFLGGDVTLSIILTCVSNFLALGFMPMWLLTLGKTILPDNVNVPFVPIYTSLLSVVIPLSVGLLINRKGGHRLRTFFQKSVKIAAMIFVLFLCTFGVYSNLYIVGALTKDYKIVLSCVLLPLTASILSFIAALIACQPRHRAITIVVETASQNTILSTVVLRASLEAPNSDLMSIIPMASGFMTLLTSVFASIIRLIYLIYTGKIKLFNREKKQQNSEKIDKKDSIESKNTCYELKNSLNEHEQINMRF